MEMSSLRDKHAVIACPFLEGWLVIYSLVVLG